MVRFDTDQGIAMLNAQRSLGQLLVEASDLVTEALRGELSATVSFKIDSAFRTLDVAYQVVSATQEAVVNHVNPAMISIPISGRSIAEQLNQGLINGSAMVPSLVASQTLTDRAVELWRDAQLNQGVPEAELVDLTAEQRQFLATIDWDRYDTEGVDLATIPIEARQFLATLEEYRQLGGASESVGQSLFVPAVIDLSTAGTTTLDVDADTDLTASGGPGISFGPQGTRAPVMPHDAPPTISASDTSSDGPGPAASPTAVINATPVGVLAPSGLFPWLAPRGDQFVQEALFGGSIWERSGIVPAESVWDVNPQSPTSVAPMDTVMPNTVVLPDVTQPMPVSTNIVPGDYALPPAFPVAATAASAQSPLGPVGVGQSSRASGVFADLFYSSPAVTGSEAFTFVDIGEFRVGTP